MRSFALFLACAVAAPSPAAAKHQLVAHFDENLVRVDAPLADGGHIRFVTDTGGGGTILFTDIADRLDLPTRKLAGASAREMGSTARQLAGRLPLAAAAFPTPQGPVIVARDPFQKLLGASTGADGLIGNTWFAGHIWTWDYPHGTLSIEDPDWAPPDGAKVIPVGFRTGKEGLPALHFPRITVSIAGEDMPMLLDTGATTILTPAAAKKLGGPRLRATSMIVASRIDAWHEMHPEWPLIEGAQSGTGARMTRVPDVSIAGVGTGPVWLTERPDANFREMMSSAMNAPVEGAIGGNAFRSLRMTVDYLHGRAAFEPIG